MPADDDPDGWLEHLATESIGDLSPELVGRLDGFLAARVLSVDDKLAVEILGDRTAMAQAALTAVLDDAERVRGSRPWMELVYEGGLRVAHLSERFTRGPAQGLDALTPAEALVEVADAVFDLLVDEDMAVPFVCPEHGFGLHPLLDDGRAVWWCVPPNHVVAAIGRLGDG